MLRFEKKSLNMLFLATRFIGACMRSCVKALFLNLEYVIVRELVAAFGNVLNILGKGKNGVRSQYNEWICQHVL